MNAETMRTGTVEANPAIGTYPVLWRGPKQKTSKLPVWTGDEAQSPQQWLAAESTYPYLTAMDPAIYALEVWLSAAVFVNGRLMEICEDCCSVTPELGVGFELWSHLCAQCVAHSVKLCGLWIPRAPSKPAPIVTEFLEFEEEALKEAMDLEVESLEHSMDIAIGAI